MPDEMQPTADPDEKAVRKESAELREFVNELKADDISSGQWFTKLLEHSLHAYANEIDWRYFQQKYEGLPPDAIVEQRIRMAARYAAIEGGLSASAYSAAVIATIGSMGTAGAVAVPAAVASMMVDVAYTARLQLRLAYDISVLYRVPLDASDPDDLWKLLRIAFTVKSGEAVGEGLLKAVPILVRPLVRRFYRRGVLQAARGLPVVGRYLLQRNVVKVGIPLVGVPLATVVNRQTTLIAGRHARAVFRNEARIIEIAESLSRQVIHPRSALWVAWLVVTVKGRIGDDEATLLRHLARLLREDHGVIDEDLARLINLTEAAVWVRLDAEEGDLGDLVVVAEQVANVDGAATRREKAVIAAVRKRCERP